MAAAFCAVLLVLLVVLLLRRRDPDRMPGNAILVDGSNVMHWGGDPSLKVLTRVVKKLEDEGLKPYICFDANVGYKLGDRFAGHDAMAAKLGLSPKQVFVVDKGVIADGVLLDLAAEHALSIVTNDRFRDWTVTHPWVKDHRRFRRGTWKQGSVVWGSGRKR